jgi:hypothetical protein
MVLSGRDWGEERKREMKEPGWQALDHPDRQVLDYLDRHWIT